MMHPVDIVEGWAIRHTRIPILPATRNLLGQVVTAKYPDVALYKGPRREGGSHALLILAAFYTYHQGVNTAIIQPHHGRAVWGWRDAERLFSDWHVSRDGLTLRPPHGAGFIKYMTPETVWSNTKGYQWWAGFYDEVQGWDDREIPLFDRTVSYR